MLGWGHRPAPGPLGPMLLPLQVPVHPGEGLSYCGDDYEDEYDDTYDGNQVGANDADSDDELISRRPFTIPQVLRTKVPREGQEEEEEEEEAEDEAPKVGGR